MSAPGSPPAQLDARGIAQRVPHAHAMCLLRAMQRWDDEGIDCTATNHRQADHPLRSESGLLAAAAIEYAAQAMALHGALLAERACSTAAPTPGFLASVRGVQFGVARLDTLHDDLHVQARRLLAQGPHIQYAFTVRAAGGLVAQGRATVVLNTPLMK